MSLTIFPYRIGACWVFDDPRTGLKEEAFVLGTSEMISRVVEAKQIPNAADGFALSFDSAPFNHDVQLTRRAPVEPEGASAAGPQLDQQGTWYEGEILGQKMTGWLCPALLLYFEKPPSAIYAKAEPLPAGVDPVWHIGTGDPRGRRFVSAGSNPEPATSKVAKRCP
jgi:hypothetical protein